MKKAPAAIRQSSWHLRNAFVLDVFAVQLLLTPSGAASQTASLDKVIIAVPSPALSMLPVYFAQGRGLFKREGIEPALVMIAGRLQAIALSAGEIDYAASVETILRSAVQGMPFKIIVYTNASAKSVQNIIDSTKGRLQIDKAVTVADVFALPLLGEVQ